MRPLIGTSFLPYRLTGEEKRAFEETGLLIVEDALSPAQMDSLSSTPTRRSGRTCRLGC